MGQTTHHLPGFGMIGHKDGDAATTDDAADLTREAPDDLVMIEPCTTALLSRGCLLTQRHDNALV
jgi:hypothetical protein